MTARLTEPEELAIAYRGVLAVQIQGSAAVLDRISVLLAPYIRVSRAQPAPSSWSIRWWPHSRDHLGLSRVTLPGLGEPDTILLVDGPGRRITIVEPQDPSWLPHVMARLVRVLLRFGYAEHGVIFVHGGLVALGETGVAFLGGKKSGKTSSILSLLLNARSAYVTNDDLGLRPTKRGWTGVGWSRSISVREDVLDWVQDQLGDAGLPSVHPANLDRASATGGSVLEPGTTLYPYELSEMMSRPVQDHATVTMVVFPEFSTESGTRLVPLSSADSLLRVMSMVEDVPDRHHGYLAPYFPMPDPVRVEAQIRQFVGQIPCFLLRQSMDKLRDASELIAKSLASI